MLQNSECSEISGVRIPTVSFADSVPPPFGPSGQFPLIGGIGPLCPRGALGAAAFSAECFLQIDLFEPRRRFPVGKPDLERVDGDAAEQDRQLADKVCGGIAFADGLHVRDNMVERFQQRNGEELYDA